MGRIDSAVRIAAAVGGGVLAGAGLLTGLELVGPDVQRTRPGGMPVFAGSTFVGTALAASGLGLATRSEALGSGRAGTQLLGRAAVSGLLGAAFVGVLGGILGAMYLGASAFVPRT